MSSPISPLDRVIIAYNKASYLLEKAFKKDAVTDYDRGHLAGISRAIFEFCGRWPEVLPACKPPRFLYEEGL